MRNKPTCVTPNQAAKWLTKNKSNRPLSQGTVSRYAAAMTAGEWKVNGDAIRFDEQDNLIDGQHRLHACVKSGKKFDTYIVFDLPAEAFDTIDQGRPRTMGDVLARRGEKHYATLAAAVRYFWMLQNNMNQVEKLRPSIMDRILDEHDGLREAVQVAVELCGANNRLIPPSWIAALWYCFNKIKPSKNKEFWERLLDGTGLTKEMPEYWLRRKIIESRTSTAKLPFETVFVFIIKAWNASSQNKPLKFLKWIEGEEFPKIVGAGPDLKLAKTA